MTDLPYHTEYAKSGRAECKGCKKKIEQGTLRIAIMVDTGFSVHQQSKWYHEECFFMRQHPISVDDIAGFHDLKQDDQKRIKDTMATAFGIFIPEIKGKTKAQKRSTDDAITCALNDFQIEYSKSSRALCRNCKVKIRQGELRIAKIMYDTELGDRYGGQPFWYHVKCFAEKRSDFLFFVGGESLPGFMSLSKKDQVMIKTEIKPVNPSDVPVKKSKDQPNGETELKEESVVEKQNKLFQKYRIALSELTKAELDELLKVNSQEIPPGKTDCLDCVADMMIFGALKPCPECNGQLELDILGYKCQGKLTNLTECSYVTQTPERVAMIVPNSYKIGVIFKTYEPKTDVRLFQQSRWPAMAVVQQQLLYKKLPVPPLKNLQFYFYGKWKGREETKRRILKLGGLCIHQLTDTLAAVVSTKNDVDRMSDKMKEIKDLDIEVVDSSFLDQIARDGTVAKSLEVIKDNNIADWGSDDKIFELKKYDIKDFKRFPEDIITVETT